MNITEIRGKYHAAKDAFLRHRYTNQTNNIEKEYEEMSMEFLKRYFPEVKKTGNSLTNYLGADFICWDEDENAVLVDQKTCVGLEGMNVLVDAWKKKDKYDKTYPIFALDNKATEYFLFINKSILALVPFEVIYEKTKQVPKSDCFFMERDIYQTTKKAIITLSPNDCTHIRRRVSTK